MFPRHVVVGKHDVGLLRPPESHPVGSDLDAGTGTGESGPRRERARLDRGCAGELPRCHLTRSHDLHGRRPLEEEAYAGGVLGKGHLELLLESGRVDVEVGRAHRQHVLVGRCRTRFVPVAAQIGLPCDAPGHFGWMQSPGENAAGGALQEALETSFETACQAHRREVTVGPGTVLPTTGTQGATVRFRLDPGRVAELADAQDSGSCDRKIVGVQVPPRPPPLQGGPTPLVSPRGRHTLLARPAGRKPVT